MYDRNNPPRWYTMRLVEKSGGLWVWINIIKLVGLHWIEPKQLHQTPIFELMERGDYFAHLPDQFHRGRQFGFGGVGLARRHYSGASIWLPLMQPDKSNLVSKTLSVLQLVTHDQPEFSNAGRPRHKHQTAMFMVNALNGPQGRHITGEITPDGVRRLKAMSPEALDAVSKRANEAVRRVWEASIEYKRQLLGVDNIDSDLHQEMDGVSDRGFVFSCSGCCLAVLDRSYDTFQFGGHNVDASHQQLALFAGLVVLCHELDKIK